MVTKEGRLYGAVINGIRDYRVMLSKVITSTRAMDAASGDVAYTGVTFEPTAIMALAWLEGKGKRSS